VGWVSKRRMNTHTHPARVNDVLTSLVARSHSPYDRARPAPFTPRHFLVGKQKQSRKIWLECR
jgi:hypothetical protein